MLTCSETGAVLIAAGTSAHERIRRVHGDRRLPDLPATGRGAGGGRGGNRGA